MHFEDGDRYTNRGVSTTAVGWLQRGHKYPRGRIPTAVIQKLAELLSKPVWEPYFSPGYHACDLGLCVLRDSLARRLHPFTPPFTWALSRREQNLEERRQHARAVTRAVERHQRKRARSAERQQIKRAVLKGSPSRFREKSERHFDYERLLARVVDSCAHQIFSLGASGLRLIAPTPSIKRGASRVPLGTRNLVIPGGDCAYMSPSLIYHYISAHHYLPPDLFCAAVIECPPMDSYEYFKALRPAFPALDANAFVSWVDQQMKLMAEMMELSTNMAGDAVVEEMCRRFLPERMGGKRVHR